MLPKSSSSFLSLLTLISVASANREFCTNGPRTIGGRSCVVNCSLDRAGGDYAQLKVNTYEGCWNACASERQCVTAQYNVGSGWCYLKNVKNADIPTNGHGTIDCDPSTSYTPPACVSGTRQIGSRACNVTCGADRPGGDYGYIHTESLEGCLYACADDNACVSAVYNEANGWCYAKNRPNAMTSVAGQTVIDCTGVQ